MRYVSYRRLSKLEPGKEGLGLDAQATLIKHFYPDIEKDFKEVQSGATAIDRPVLQQAIKYCIENDAILVVAKADRLSRDVIDALTIFDKLKGNLRCCDLPGDPPERFMLTLWYAFAERERLIISLRITNALAEIKKKGRKLGLHMTHNKKGEPMDQNRLKDWRYKKKGAEALKMMAAQNENTIRAREYAAALRESGKSLDDIARRLNNAKFATPKGGKFSKGGVCRLLKKVA